MPEYGMPENVNTRKRESQNTRMPEYGRPENVNARLRECPKIKYQILK